MKGVQGKNGHKFAHFPHERHDSTFPAVMSDMILWMTAYTVCGSDSFEKQNNILLQPKVQGGLKQVETHYGVALSLLL